jgi:hypothetical protein
VSADDPHKHYGLRQYEADRAANRIVEGDEPSAGPSGNKARVDALLRGTRSVTTSERKWAVDSFAIGDPVWRWNEAQGRHEVTSIEQWDAGLAPSITDTLKVDA